MTHTLRTARIFTPRTTEDGFRLLVTRSAPRVPRERKFWDEWDQRLSPTYALHTERLKRGKSEDVWVWFEPRFREEMRRPYAEAAMADVRRLLETRTVTLLCFCTDLTRCHTAVVRDLILTATT